MPVESRVGGGFGPRGEFYPQDFLIQWAAIMLGRQYNGSRTGGST
jgi:hypothetical protein